MLSHGTFSAQKYQDVPLTPTPAGGQAWAIARRPNGAWTKGGCRRVVERVSRRVLLIAGVPLLLALLRPLPLSLDRGQLALGGLLLGTVRLALHGEGRRRGCPDPAPSPRSVDRRTDEHGEGP